ncbi:MAG: 1,4-alpha-glucan branching protein domain-containing protein [Chthoniobacterales bacterium]
MGSASRPAGGYLALILHAHLPFVRHPEYEEALEEEWFFEAITESYIPLIAVMQRLRDDRVPFQLTMTVTPTLCAMLNDPLLRERYVRYVERGIDLAAREIAHNRHDDQMRGLAEFYLRMFNECRRRFVDEWRYDLLAVLRELRESGSLEIIASAATHAMLPLLQETPKAARAQVLIGRDIYEANFHGEAAGFWLPECAFAPGLDAILQEANLRWFVVDAHGLLFGHPRPRRAIYAPCYTPAGPAAYARDRTSSRQVWSATEGYPGDPSYREFYHDIGFQRPASYLWPGANEQTVPRFTGLKYHRVTGGDLEKQFYDPAVARRTADAHARHFLEARRSQIKELRTYHRPPIVVTPFDAELFGHWWFEGPHFLEMLIRKAAYDQSDFEMTTPSRFLAEHSSQQIISPAASTWGENGQFAVWIDQSNSWIYPHLHASARRMSEAARAHAQEASPLATRTLKQMVRELLLMQASDWAFLMKTGTAKEYATKRTTEHVLRFNKLYDQLSEGQLDENFLGTCEARDNLFPDVNWRYYI